MTTRAPRDLSSPGWKPELTQDLQNFLEGVVNDSSLFEPGQLRARLEVLDALDTRLVGLEGACQKLSRCPVHNRAQAIRTRLEALNVALYKSMHSEIVRGARPRILPRWIQASPPGDETAPGLGYDYRDDVVSGVLQLREPCEPRFHPLPEMVFYQPTPVRHILHLITATALSRGDVFVDLGSGLGHVTLLASILSGVRSVGIEVEPAYVASAQECARRLHLHRVLFICKDARSADLSSGTVFYLYSPFTGSILADVLDRLKNDCTHRQIKICALGPCTRNLAMQSWLKPLTVPDSQRITVFETCL
jgi:hypothetical protein